MLIGRETNLQEICIQLHWQDVNGLEFAFDSEGCIVFTWGSVVILYLIPLLDVTPT